jgi:hypothetical protein
MRISGTYTRVSGIVALAAVLTASGPTVWAQSTPSLSDILGQLTFTSASSGDSTLKSLGSELASKAKSLSKSLADSPDTQNQLSGALQAVLGNKGGDALAAFQKVH